MESLQVIKSRLKSIGNTRQITQSMRLVSTSKAQKARLRIEENRPFFEQAIKMSSAIAKSSRGSRHPYVFGRKVENSLIILITSDRGLCGGYNINIEKEALWLAKTLGNTKVIAIGSKGRDYCRRRKKDVAYSFTGLSENPFFEDAREIAAVALDMYDSKKVDQVYLAYTQYHSMLSQTPVTIRLLPFTPEDSEAGTSEALMRYEPGEDVFLQNMVSMYVRAVLFGAMLESSASEQSARVASMDAASKNSGEIIDSLTLAYNQIRQGAITQELAEIVGGADALRNIE